MFYNPLHSTNGLTFLHNKLFIIFVLLKKGIKLNEWEIGI